MNINFEVFVSTIDYSKIKSFSNLDEYNKHNFKDALIESVLYQEFYEICPYDWEKIYQVIDEKGYHDDTSDICDYIQSEIVQQIINNDDTKLSDLRIEPWYDSVEFGGYNVFASSEINLDEIIEKFEINKHITIEKRDVDSVYPLRIEFRVDDECVHAQFISYTDIEKYLNLLPGTLNKETFPIYENMAKMAVHTNCMDWYSKEDANKLLSEYGSGEIER